MSDEKIKKYFSEDGIVSDKANMVFDNFISNVREKSNLIDNINEPSKQDNIIEFNKKDNSHKNTVLTRFKFLATMVASLCIAFIGLNSYAHTKGFDNFFFLIKEITLSVFENDRNAIFSDIDIVISYKYFNITDNIEMQINEFQAKDNKAKLYLLVKESSESKDTPFKYKVYNENNKLMFNAKSQKQDNEKIYTEILELANYDDNVEKIKLEIFNNNDKLLKTVVIDLNEKIIEARTENDEIKKISQIELNRFLKDETKKCYSEQQLKNREIIIVSTYDIYYENSKYIVKYLYIMPSDKDFEKDKVENSNIYINTIELQVNENEFELLKIENPEIFDNL